MKNVKTTLLIVIVGLSVIACPLLYFLVGPGLSEEQLETLKILGIVCAASAVYCFVVGEIAKNNSQMDKLWSLLPEVYLWIMAIRSGMEPRLVIMACIATLWGIRLTFNFARKGAYSIKFWAGEEDYRWKVLRERKEFQPRVKWVLFNLFFISVYQNVLVLMTTFPGLVVMGSKNPIGPIDIVAAVLMTGCVVYELIADEQQWRFYKVRNKYLAEGKKLEEMPAPYNKGFNTTGLWGISRHPNYLAEQGTWFSLYLFSIGAGVGIFNWSFIGALLLIILFQGSSIMGEGISRSKYPEYENYIKNVSKFFPTPWKKYK